MDPSKYGAVKRHGGNNSFMFLVSEDFSKSHKNSRLNSKNTRLTNAEARLLSSLLRKEGLCVKGSSSPEYVITSKQEKVYDITYASLIEENYNAKSITPLTFYGYCK